MKKLRNIHIGCSGFSYKDWKGTFYPSRIDQSEMIAYYEKFFDVVEINYTFYTMPHPYTVEGFLEKTKRLRFAVKVNRVFTHERNYSGEDLKRFLEGCKPLLDSNRFICFLFQFPQSFGYSAESVDYLRRISEDFGGFQRVVEFRSRSFGRPEVYEVVESLGFSLVNVDAPKVKGVLVGPWRSVGVINYVRLHGRNRDRWHDHREAFERYDYLYSEEELKGLKEKVLSIYQGKDTYVFFNNHYRGKGAYNALQMKELFGERVSIPKGLTATFSAPLWE
ncbi:MAG: DUF72 domain-containing protein [Aquificota bacterium]|nr:DUF72 domain-containing protein [Aquificota bacterium]